jgi:hypothetical protein
MDEKSPFSLHCGLIWIVCVNLTVEHLHLPREVAGVDKRGVDNKYGLIGVRLKSRQGIRRVAHPFDGAVGEQHVVVADVRGGDVG